MIAVIERFTPWRTISASLRALAQQGIVDRRIRRAVALIRADPGAVSDMDVLAREVGLSRAQFFRQFERSLNVTPRVFLNVVRMELAVAAVVHGEASFTKLSDELGFSVPAHFTRFFRDHAGACPSEFRAVARLAAG